MTCKPGTCRRCGTALSGDDPQPLRHQVWELPEIRPLVTEYQRHRLECPGCGESTCGELPPGVPTGQSGPRLIALVALLMAYFRQSKRSRDEEAVELRRRAGQKVRRCPGGAWDDCCLLQAQEDEAWMPP